MRRMWTDSEIRALKVGYPETRTRELASRLNHPLHSVYGMAKKLGLHKTADFIKTIGIQKGQRINPGGEFKKGHAPANKGFRRPGWHSGRMRETQFKKGQLPHTYHPVGTVMPDADGYLRVKVRERGPGDKGGWDPRVWPALHRHTWESANGEIPLDHVVVFKDGNKQNCEIGNLEIISRGELANRNRMWGRLPQELAEAIQLNGVLKRKIRSLRGQK